MFATGSPLVILMLTLAVQPRPSVEDVPPVERQTPDFYNALATGPKGVQATWTVDPATVPVNGELTLTLTIRHVANPHELAKPDLRKLPDFTRRFQILDRTDPPAKPDATETRFTYGLRPRSTDVTAVPSLKYVYLRRDGESWKPLTTFARSVPITVTAPTTTPKATAAPIPLDAPEEFFTLAEEHPTTSPGRYGWLLPIALVPLVVIAWVLLWRWLFPDAVRLAKLRRNRAARLALDRLKKARKSPDPAGSAATAFRGYLSARFGMPPAAQTPAEVSAALHSIECPIEKTADAEAFLRACDAARFTPTPDHGLSLTLQAESLILAWEGVSE